MNKLQQYLKLVSQKLGTPQFPSPNGLGFQVKKTVCNKFESWNIFFTSLLGLFSPELPTRKQGNIPLRKNSNTWQQMINTNMATDDKYEQEINELEEEIKSLKQSRKQQHDPKTEMYRNKINLKSKKDNTASVSHRGQQEHVELITVINFIEQTMKTLSNHGEQLKTQLDFNLTQQDKELT